MKTLFYIQNTKTDQSYDTMEGKFYDNSWSPELEEDRGCLQHLIDQDPEKFENCVIEEVEA